MSRIANTGSTILRQGHEGYQGKVNDCRTSRSSKYGTWPFARRAQIFGRRTAEAQRSLSLIGFLSKSFSELCVLSGSAVYFPNSLVAASPR